MNKVIPIDKQISSLLIFNVLILSVLFLMVQAILTISPPVTASPSNTTMTIPIYEITTRGGLASPASVSGNGYGDRYPLLDVEELFGSCPDEIAIFVHGWGLSETDVKERIDRLKMSLEHNGYFVPLVSLSWDSNVQWDAAKSNAVQDGPKLGHFILDYMNTCRTDLGKDVNVRLIAHSMGSRVVLSALNNLNMNESWNNNNFKIRSVHLVGAAVDDEEVFKGSGFSVLARIQASLSYSLVNTENVSFAILEPCRFD